MAVIIMWLESMEWMKLGGKALFWRAAKMGSSCFLSLISTSRCSVVDTCTLTCAHPALSSTREAGSKQPAEPQVCVRIAGALVLNLTALRGGGVQRQPGIESAQERSPEVLEPTMRQQKRNSQRCQLRA